MTNSGRSCVRINLQLATKHNQYLGVNRNGRLTLFGSSVLCNSSDTCSIGSTWCRHIDGNSQMADNSIHYSGGINAGIGRLIPPGGITAWNAWVARLSLNTL